MRECPDCRKLVDPDYLHSCTAFDLETKFNIQLQLLEFKWLMDKLLKRGDK